MPKVALIRCESYDERTVKKAFERALDLLGGISRFAASGEKILLKPNILAGEPPKKCVTTHPAVFRAVAEAFLDAGAIVCYGDSPAIGRPEKAAKKAGLARVADELNIPLGDFKTGVDVMYDKGLQNRKFTIAKAVADSDGVVSLPKLKTHGLEKFTGAVKNQFGCIPGVLKGEFHLRLPDPEAFGRMLVDLNFGIRPRLYVMDGIYGMEGNGPRGGKPRRMNLLAVSEDPVALDAVISRMVRLNPEYVPTTKLGMQVGMGTYLEEEIHLVGDDPGQFMTGDFDINRKPMKAFKPGVLSGFLNSRIVAKPVIREEKCVRCGVCAEVCPADPKAVFFPDGDRSSVPVYNYDHCINCFCCQELCPESAIHLKTPLLRKLVDVLL